MSDDELRRQERLAFGKIYRKLRDVLHVGGYRVREIDVFEEAGLWDRYGINGTVRSFSDARRKIIFIDLPRAIYEVALVHELIHAAYPTKTEVETSWLTDLIIRNLTARQLATLKRLAKSSQA